MKKCFIFIRVVCFCALLIGILGYLSNILSSTKIEEYPVRYGFFQNINAEADNTIDIFFVGDSSVMHAINPVQIWKESKITSYNMSYSVMEPKEAYFDLKKVFKKQSPKYVFIEAQFLIGLNKGGFDFFSTATQNIMDYCDNEIDGVIDSYFPVMKYKSSWKTLHPADLLPNHPDAINSIYKGYKYAPEVDSFLGIHGQKDNGTAVFKNNGNIYFENIYNLCQENNCEVVLFNLPQGVSWNKIKHDKAFELAKKYNVSYIDYDLNLETEIPDFSWKTDTKDAGGHLNYSGATKLTSAIEKYLTDELNMNNSSLTSKNVDKWNNDANEFYKVIGD